MSKMAEETQGGQIKRVIFVGTQAAIINVTDETASLCKLLHLGETTGFQVRKTYGYSRPFFISLGVVTISSRAAHGGKKGEEERRGKGGKEGLKRNRAFASETDDDAR